MVDSGTICSTVTSQNNESPAPPEFLSPKINHLSHKVTLILAFLNFHIDLQPLHSFNILSF